MTDQDTFDSFAATALNALLVSIHSNNTKYIDAVRKSFIIADMMMAERKKWDCEGNGPITIGGYNE
jgi:hypothetical protein